MFKTPIIQAASNLLDERAEFYQRSVVRHHSGGMLAARSMMRQQEQQNHMAIFKSNGNFTKTSGKRRRAALEDRLQRPGRTETDGTTQ